jgi:general secretion pathway protein D
VRAIVDKLDIRRAQVHVEAIIVEMSADRAAELGVTWALDARENGAVGLTNFSRIGPGVIQLGGAAAAGTSSLNIIPDGMTLGVGRIQAGGVSFGTIIRALAGDGRTNILSTPSLVTLDNVEAEIKVGQEVPFLTGQYSNTGGGTTPANPFQTIERKDVGLILRVKPQITEGGSVKLTIYEEVSRIEDTTNAAGIITNKRSLESTVMVDDGQIIVLGGLIQDSFTDGTSKVPLVGDVPLFGQLFRYDNRRRIKTNLMVFLKPTVVRTSSAGASLTGDRYDYLIGEQQRLAPGPRPFWPDPTEPRLPPITQPPAPVATPPAPPPGAK